MQKSLPVIKNFLHVINGSLVMRLITQIKMDAVHDIHRSYRVFYSACVFKIALAICNPIWK